jgi:hypothetical protein
VLKSMEKVPHGEGWVLGDSGGTFADRQQQRRGSQCLDATIARPFEIDHGYSLRPRTTAGLRLEVRTDPIDAPVYGGVGCRPFRSV